jgi:hypothetical protein
MVATLRLANQDGPSVYRATLRLWSLVGTPSTNGSHLHLAVSDSTYAPSVGICRWLRWCTRRPGNRTGRPFALNFRREPDPTLGTGSWLWKSYRLPTQLLAGVKKKQGKSLK